jgi:ornithine decarboxylase
MPDHERRTPWLELDVSIAVDQYRSLQQALPQGQIHYAVKANPHPILLSTLRGLGSSFDVASPAEVDAAISAGADPAELVYSNTIKRRDDITRAHAAGVRLFATDSLEETRKIAAAAPGAGVLARLVTSGEGSDWPLSRKFGCSTGEAEQILRLAADLGLDPAGISFHVGSQQRDPHAWRAPILAAARLFSVLGRAGLQPHTLDIGGGFPALHEGHHPSFAAYGEAITSAMDEAFDGMPRPRLFLEPGRGIVGDAGVLVTSVIAVVWRGDSRWVYLDAGVFSGLVETLDEAIRYRLSTSADGPTRAASKPGRVDPELTPAVLAGPTCDSADILYERTPVLLPADLREGDRVYVHSAGAYTTAYSTVGFNGFEPLPTRLVSGVTLVSGVCGVSASGAS